MKFLLRPLLLSFLLLISASSFAQLTGKALQAERFFVRATSSVYKVNGNSVKGSPYMEDEFKDGIIYGTQKTYRGIPMRFNIYDDNVEFLENGGTFILEPDARLRKIVIGNTVLVIDKYERANQMRQGFLQQLDSGKFTLLYRPVVLFKEQESPTPMKYQGEPARFVKGGESFYYKTADGPTIRIEKVSKLVDSFTEKQDEVKAFVKREKIRSEKEDLTRLFKYYNSLF